jgi:hypothetical protein
MDHGNQLKFQQDNPEIQYQIKKTPQEGEVNSRPAPFHPPSPAQLCRTHWPWIICSFYAPLLAARSTHKRARKPTSPLGSP